MLREELHAWRGSIADLKGVPRFHIFSNATLDMIVAVMPRDADELRAVKGVGPAKIAEFGADILMMTSAAMARGETADPEFLQVLAEESLARAAAKPARVKKEKGGASALMPLVEDIDAEGNASAILSDATLQEVAKPAPDAMTVDAYLTKVNKTLEVTKARVQGEVVSVKEQGVAVYFALKDPQANATLSAFMWQRDYVNYNIKMEAGTEVIITGHSEIYKPSGRYAFRAHAVEYAGEGALKKAYDELQKKLAAEGLFAPERKRELKKYPRKIGLITSKTGAVIHDFTNNLGAFGYQVHLVDSRVEGVAAVQDLLEAFEKMRTQDLDCLVIVRGGGSLESLQAFNNEQVVRAIAQFPVPTICAIGHDQDVPLAQYASDYAPSTPTAATVILNASWLEVTQLLARHHEKIRYELARVREETSRIIERFMAHARTLGSHLRTQKDHLYRIGKTLDAHDPLRQLARGYSIVRNQDGGILRSVKDVPPGTQVDIRLADGMVSAKII
ncbi:exodeoxyribonuclease VII large subunit [Candidatus Kaiserbacteria bacterium RIFCSPLOWO2_12_FULL_50_10]|nr:MAG: exodeoxyribonuclease VII large subunit [Candidatus Kaiserbacteria bacterium RIFCSPLOWO2_12_FULL_50_10]